MRVSHITVIVGIIASRETAEVNRRMRLTVSRQSEKYRHTIVKKDVKKDRKKDGTL